MQKRTDPSPLGRGPRRGRAYLSAAPSRGLGPASATLSHQTPLGSSGLHASCLDLWREKNDQLVRQAKVTWLLGPLLCSPKLSEGGFPVDLPQLTGGIEFDLPPGARNDWRKTSFAIVATGEIRIDPQ